MARGYNVLDVIRPNRQLRYLHRKSDSIDAESAARSVVNRQATAYAKAQTGSSEMIRHRKISRDSAVKARSLARITLQVLIITTPADSEALRPAAPKWASTTGFDMDIVHRDGVTSGIQRWTSASLALVA